MYKYMSWVIAAPLIINRKHWSLLQKNFPLAIVVARQPMRLKYFI
jgi:hypothetical protein